MLLGPALGGDEREIVLIHATRIVMVILIIPPAFRLASGYVPPANLGSGGTILAMSMLDLAILIATGVAGFLVGRLLRIPAYQMTGPMLLSAAVHIGGITAARPPYELLAAAQVIIGCGAGARFCGVHWNRLVRPMLLSAVATTGLIGLAAAFSLALAPVTGVDFRAILLAYTPGGFAEMNLIALSLGIEVAFVAMHHTMRIFAVVTVAAWCARLIWKTPPNERRDDGRDAGPEPAGT
jgi:membrane AbrB-like protein